MTDGLTERYGDLLCGGYDCVDRIVLNAYHPLLHGPGGFRHWWRRLYDGSDEQPDNAHLMRMAGRFARRVRAFAKAKGIPVIDCPRGQRKHRIAEDYLATHTVGTGMSSARQAACSATWRRRPPTSTTARSTSWTPTGGASRSRCPAIPRSARRSSTGGHELVACQARKAGSTSSRKATASLRSPTAQDWQRSQTPCPSRRRSGA